MSLKLLFCLVLFVSLAVGKKQAIISEEEASEMEAGGDSKEEPRLVRPEPNRELPLRSLSSADGNNTSKYETKQHQH